MLSACCPCLSGDVQRCWRWLGRRLFCIALHGSVLIESGHGPSSGGYVHDMVPLDQTVAECDMGHLKVGDTWAIIDRSGPYAWTVFTDDSLMVTGTNTDSGH